MVGYPTQNNTPDYERLALIHQAVILEIALTQENKFIGTNQFEIKNLTDLSSLQGFSGSAVFSLTPTSPGMANLGFEGLVLSATVESRKVLVLQERMIRSYVDKIESS